jgi:NADPH:quinone reductase-like Zn-dependent oxidoreductase
MRRVIYERQSLVGFHIRSLGSEEFARSVAGVFGLVAGGKLRVFTETSFPLERAADALEALAARRTIGKVVLLPHRRNGAE